MYIKMRRNLDVQFSLTWMANIALAIFAYILKKEVIQPQVPLRLPCYDFIPVTSPALGRCLPRDSSRTSGKTGFHDVTGGVYKARERIHGAVADAPLLAIPTSWRRVAASNPNWAHLFGIGSTLRSCVPL